MNATRVDLKLDVRPFRAWRYASSKVETSRVIAPPYDVISPGEREALYAKSPYNVIRLILGKEPDFHERAARLWQEWSGEGILVQDPRPAFYLYEQIFKHPLTSRPLSRTALVGTLKLDEPGAVFRHETTFDAPKRDRMLLLEKTRTNLSPIFCLYRDSSRLVDLFSFCRKSPPLCEAREDQDLVHRLWTIEREEDQKLIREALAFERILIADGHHRYETALEYRRRMRERLPGAAWEAPFDFVLAALVAEDDPGLLVLPTHRIIRSLETVTVEKFLEHLRKHFDLIPCPDSNVFQALCERPKSEKAFGVILKSGSFVIRLKCSGEASHEIEANLLPQFIFDRLWGFSAERRQNLIEYTRFPEEAVRAVREEKAQAAFLMRTPEVDTIRELAYAGARMPEKTTYFYPKLASGLLFYHHE